MVDFDLNEVDVVDEASLFVEDGDVCFESADVTVEEEANDVNASNLYITPTKLSSGSIIGVAEAPIVGMNFPNFDKLDTYYKTYGQQQGFGVVRASSGGVKSKDGVFQRRNQTWTCEFYGRPDMRRHAKKNKMAVASDSQYELANDRVVSKKCDCPVHIYGSMNKQGEWVIRRVVNEHKNHAQPTPSKSRYISMYRKLELTSRVRRQLKMGRSAGLKPRQMHNLLALERNGLDQMGLSCDDIRNEEKDGDAKAMISYFHKMTSDNCNFCHTYRLDEHDQLQDVVWVDARSRVAYKDFCDVVCFDATYLTNEYELPFANWVGVNHHGQSILLGCALVSRETAETYEWVFDAWLNFMGGQAPGGILTDQALAM